MAETPRTDACPRCKGTGKILVGMFSEPGKQREATCNVCNGTKVLRDLEAEIAELAAKLARAQTVVRWADIYLDANSRQMFAQAVREAKEAA